MCLRQRLVLYTGQQISPVIGFPETTLNVWPGTSVITPPKRTFTPVRFQPDRILGFFTWLWQPVFEAGHHENSPVKLSFSQAHTAFAGHSLFEADAFGATTNRAPASNVAAASALRNTFLVSGTNLRVGVM
jgi:hypothetical protein